MKHEILNLLVEMETISKEKADILSHCVEPGSIYGLYKDVGLANGRFDDVSDCFITDKEIKALVQFENLLAGSIPEKERNTSLPLLMFILVRILEYTKNPTELTKKAMDNVFASYENYKKNLEKEIQKVALEQIDDYVNRFKTDIFKM